MSLMLTVKRAFRGQRQIVPLQAIHTNEALLDEPYHGLSQRVINDIFAILKEARNPEVLHYYYHPMV